MKRSNAERQKAYRARKRNACNAPATPIYVPPSCKKDFIKDGFQYIYLGDWGYGPQYAKVIG